MALNFCSLWIYTGTHVHLKIHFYQSLQTCFDGKWPLISPSKGSGNLSNLLYAFVISGLVHVYYKLDKNNIFVSKAYYHLHPLISGCLLQAWVLQNAPFLSLSLGRAASSSALSPDLTELCQRNKLPSALFGSWLSLGTQTMLTLSSSLREAKKKLVLPMVY